MSEFSDVLAVKTKFTSLPDEPTNVTVLSTTGGSATLSWGVPLDFGGVDVTSYELTFFPVLDIATQFKQVLVNASTKATTLTGKVSGLNATTAYGFFVVPVNDISACVDASVFAGYKVAFASTGNVSTPEVPQNLSVSATTAGMQVITWLPTLDKGGDPIVYYVLMSETGAVLYNGTQTQFRRGSLALNTTYGYAVMATNIAGSSVQSPLVFKKTQSIVTAPGTPTNVILLNATGGSITLAWTAPVDLGGAALLGYRILRNDKALVVSSNATLLQATTFVDSSGLVTEQEYLYSIQAVNTYGSGIQTEPLTVRTTTATLPVPPVNLTVAAVGGTLSATWLAPGDVGGVPLVGFSVRVAKSGVVQFETQTLDAFMTYYGVDADTTYSVSVAAVTRVGTGAEATRLVTNGNATRPQAPLAPEIVSSTAQSVVLALRGPLDDGGANITALNLYQDGVLVRSVQTSGYFQVVVGPLFASKSYSFQTTAISLAELGESPLSAPVQARTAGPTVPSVVYGLALTHRTFDALTFTWEGPDDIGGETVVFEVDYVVKGSTSASTTMTVTTRNATIRGLTPSTSYIVMIRAVNSAGASAWSTAAQGDTDVARRGAVVLQLDQTTVFENATSVTYQIVRVNGTGSTITCAYDVEANSTAVAGENFVLPSADLRVFTFVDGETLKTFTLELLNDEVFQPTPMRLTLTLRDTTVDRSDTVSPSSVTLAIVDDGDAGWIDFAVSNVTVFENASILALPLRRVRGSSSATSVRVSVLANATATATTPGDFTIATPIVTFHDGEVNQSAVVQIWNNSVYSYPLKSFALVVSSESGGAQIGITTVVWATILDDGDNSVPGLVRDLTAVNVTGGMIKVTWTPPVNVGGQNLSITRYNLSISTGGGESHKTFVISKDNATEFAFGSLQSHTQYSLQVAAMNAVGTGLFCVPMTQSTNNFTTPGAVGTIALVNATGGLLTVQVAEPLDRGGSPILTYLMYVARASDGIFQVRRCWRDSECDERLPTDSTV